MRIIEEMESEVRSYCRSFKATFETARGSVIEDSEGKSYIDFFAGAGALNYGHNPPDLQERLVEYMLGNGVTHGLDMATAAKCTFLETLRDVILEPRGMEYRAVFPGPTGTNAVEVALKTVRKATGRTSVVTFTNAFHGMTLGSLSATGSRASREAAAVGLGGTIRLPFDGYLGPGTDTLDLLERMLDDPSSGLDLPAGILLETVQAEGGVNVASPEWLRRLAALAGRFSVPLIVDDIQVGCGRTGPFFSFEESGVKPDIICLSKSLSGYGLPFALTLIRPELDLWEPGEHNGTFRGNNLAMVTATEALNQFWRTPQLARDVARKGAIIESALASVAAAVGAGETRGRGMIRGLALPNVGLARRAARLAFRRGLIIETAGPRGEVLKLLPPLTIENELLAEGLNILRDSVLDAAHARRRSSLQATEITT